MATAVPFVSSLAPSERARAMGAALEVDIGDIPPGGMKTVDEAQLAFKHRADPLGLMNPGKVRAWDERVLGLKGRT